MIIICWYIVQIFKVKFCPCLISTFERAQRMEISCKNHSRMEKKVQISRISISLCITKFFRRRQNQQQLLLTDLFQACSHNALNTMHESMAAVKPVRNHSRPFIRPTERSRVKEDWVSQFLSQQEAWDGFVKISGWKGTHIKHSSWKASFFISVVLLFPLGITPFGSWISFCDVRVGIAHWTDNQLSKLLTCWFSKRYMIPHSDSFPCLLSTHRDLYEVLTLLSAVS